jgi:hypothetical protein
MGSKNTPSAFAMRCLLVIWPSWLEAIVVREVMSSASEEIFDDITSI